MLLDLLQMTEHLVSSLRVLLRVELEVIRFYNFFLFGFSLWAIKILAIDQKFRLRVTYRHLRHQLQTLEALHHARVAHPVSREYVGRYYFLLYELLIDI